MSANTLEGEFWKNRYQGLIRVYSNTGVSGTTSTIIDGNGNETELSLSTTDLALSTTGTITVGDNATAIKQDTGGGVAITASAGDLVLQSTFTDSSVVLKGQSVLEGDTYLNGELTTSNDGGDIVAIATIDCQDDIKTDSISGSGGSQVSIYGSVFTTDKVEVTNAEIDVISGKTSATAVQVVNVTFSDKTITADTIKSSGATFSIDDNTSITGTLAVSSNITQSAGTSALQAITGTTITASSNIITDVIAERTSGTGVTIDGVLLKDSGVVCSTVPTISTGTTTPSTTPTKVGDIFVDTAGGTLYFAKGTSTAGDWIALENKA